MTRVMRRPSSLTSSISAELVGPIVSKAIGTKLYDVVSWLYFAICSAAAASSAAALTTRDVWGRYTEECHSVRHCGVPKKAPCHRPPCHRMSVSPPEHFPLVLEMPGGSMMLGTPQASGFGWWCRLSKRAWRICLDRVHMTICVNRPPWSTLHKGIHVCGAHRSSPQSVGILRFLSPRCHLSSLKLQAISGSASNQTPAWAAVPALRRARWYSSPHPANSVLDPFRVRSHPTACDGLLALSPSGIGLWFSSDHYNDCISITPSVSVKLSPNKDAWDPMGACSQR